MLVSGPRIKGIEVRGEKNGKAFWSQGPKGFEDISILFHGTLKAIFEQEIILQSQCRDKKDRRLIISTETTLLNSKEMCLQNKGRS